MVRRIFFVLTFVMVGVYACSAQCCGSNQLMMQQITAKPFVMYYLQYDDSPFFRDEWSNATLKLVSGETYDNLKVRLDIFKDELVYYNEKIRKQLIVDKDIISEIRFVDEDTQYEYLVINVCDTVSAEKRKYKFYFVHVSDSISLWSVQKKEIETYNNTTSKMLGNYYNNPSYYKVINGQLKSILLHKRPIAKLFPSNKRAILTFIKENRINVKNYNDLTTLFVKINELEKANPSKYNQ